jgi:CBS-domain-containing membrane protein
MHNHMEDDQILVQTALTLARAVRDDMPKDWFTRKAVMPGVGKTIRDISRKINSPDVEKEVWRFGAYITDILDNDDLDGMISDHLETAATMSENEDYYG